jgi:hypothetical protein
MECREIEAALVDLLYEELAASEQSRLLAHIEGCRECRERWSELRTLAAAADRWEGPSPSRGICERALARVATERAREVARRGAELSSARVLRHVGLGAAAALVSLLLVAGTVGREAAPVTIGVLGVVWTVLYAGVLLTKDHPRLRPVAGPALAGAGIALILTPPLSIPSVVEACERWIRAAPESGVFAMVLVLFAAGYTAGPLMIGALALGRPRPESRIVEEATLSGVYALLIAPAVYVECAGLPLDVTALWMAGAILGAALGGPAGLRAGRWLRGLA